MWKTHRQKSNVCDYIILSEGEIKKLKNNGYDPHDYKDGSEQDLFKCKPSGKVVVGRKSWHQDENGEWVAGDGDFEDTDININELPWKRSRKVIMEETIIEFRIRGLSRPIDKVLEKLPVQPDKVWRKGDLRGKSILTHKEDWFLYRADMTGVPFRQAASALIERIYPHRKEIKRACGPYDAQLSCIFYFESANRRPSIHLPVEDMIRLRGLRASLDVDLFPMSSDES